MRCSLGRLPLVGRWNGGRSKRGKKDGNLNKTHILSLGVDRSFLASSLVYPWSLDREGLVRFKGKEY